MFSALVTTGKTPRVVNYSHRVSLLGISDSTSYKGPEIFTSHSNWKILIQSISVFVCLYIFSAYSICLSLCSWCQNVRYLSWNEWVWSLWTLKCLEVRGKLTCLQRKTDLVVNKWNRDGGGGIYILLLAHILLWEWVSICTGLRRILIFLLLIQQMKDFYLKVPFKTNLICFLCIITKRMYEFGSLSAISCLSLN